MKRALFRRPSTALVLVLAGCLTANAECVATAAEPAAKSVFLIGNSLTWDTVPAGLDGDVQWHVDCGVPLPYIHAHPEKPCVKTSSLWPKALADKQYDLVSVQPHYGAALAQDVETISAWMALQPKAVLVIHSGWARHAMRADEFASYSAPDSMTHGPVYLRALVAELRRRHPGREIRQTLVQNLLAQVAEDIAAGRAPFQKIEELYRDDIHLTLGAGRYLAHNAMRRALGQPRSDAGFEGLDPGQKKYLDGVLALASPAPADRKLLRLIFQTAPAVSRSEMIARLTDADLKQRLTRLLPEIERVAAARGETLKLEADINDLGGRLTCTPTGPQWLYLATGDEGTEIFDVPAAIDLYNGNNPLKGKGGRNERVTDAGLARIAGVATLKKLDLANCAVQGDGLRHLAGLVNLRELNLTLTPVSDDALGHLGGLAELRNLGLASTQCTGTGFTHLKGLKNLQSVNFHFTPLNDAGLAAISQVPIADRLWFAHTKFTDAGAAHLKTLQQLKRCGIGSANKESSGEAVAALVNLGLEDLSLLDNQATPAGLAHATKIATLKKLDVSHGPTVTDESMGLVARMPALEEFKLGSAKVTDAGILALAESESLKKLTLSGLKGVTPAGVERLRAARPQLVIEVK